MIKQSQINSFINLIVQNNPSKKSKRYKSFQKKQHYQTEPSVFKKQNQSGEYQSKELINYIPYKIAPKIYHNIKVKLQIDFTNTKSPEKLNVYQIYRQSLQKKKNQIRLSLNQQKLSLQHKDKKDSKAQDSENGSKQLFFPINRPKNQRNSEEISSKSLKKRQLSTPIQMILKPNKYEQKLASKRSIYQGKHKLEFNYQNMVLKQGDQNVSLVKKKNFEPIFRVKKCLINNSSDEKVNKVYSILQEQMTEIKKNKGFENRRYLKDKITNHINNKKMAFFKGQSNKHQIKSNRLISFDKVDPWDYDLKDDCDIN